MTKAIALSDKQTAGLTDYKAPHGLIRRALDDIPQALLSLPRIHRVPIDFSTIQSAVDSANEDDVIELMAGEYQENIVIKRGLTVRAGVGLVIFNHATIRSQTMMWLAIGEGLVKPDSNGTWRWQAPHVSFGDSIVVLKEDGFECGYAASASSTWGRPQIDVWSCVDFVRKNIVCVPPRISDPDPMFADIENGQLRLKPGSPALGAASDGTNLGAWQGTAQ